jgi:hypothetical protein
LHLDSDRKKIRNSKGIKKRKTKHVLREEPAIAPIIQEYTAEENDRSLNFGSAKIEGRIGEILMC